MQGSQMTRDSLAYARPCILNRDSHLASANSNTASVDPAGPRQRHPIPLSLPTDIPSVLWEARQPTSFELWHRPHDSDVGC